MNRGKQSAKATEAWDLANITSSLYQLSNLNDLEQVKGE